jgi:hypothetical protein
MHSSESLVEPYSIRYKIRNDGVSQDYFYNFDTGSSQADLNLRCRRIHVEQGLKQSWIKND